MNKYYLEWSDKAPIHPKDIYGKSWENGIKDNQLIYPNDISLNEWKENEIDRYNRLCSEFEKNGKIQSLKYLDNTSKKDEIEKGKGFIKWVTI